MKPVEWVGYGDEHVARFATKAAATNAGAVSPRKVAFRFETCWVDCWDGILCKDGSRMRTAERYLAMDGAIKHVIGPRDRLACGNPCEMVDGHPFKTLALAWIGAYEP